MVLWELSSVTQGILIDVSNLIKIKLGTFSEHCCIKGIKLC